MVRAGGERLRGVGADPLGNPVQLGVSASAFVRARCVLMSLLLCLVSSLALCLVRRDCERADAAMCGPVQALHWRVVVPVGGGDGRVV